MHQYQRAQARKTRSVSLLLAEHASNAETPSNTGKKVARDQAHKHAAERLKNLATDTKLTSGKWLFYIAVDNVDAVWEKIARAIVEEKGPLRGKVYSAKVSTWEPDRVGEVHIPGAK